MQLKRSEKNSPCLDVVSSFIQRATMLKCKKSKSSSQNEQELLYRRLESILKQMLLVLAKESVALNTISGKNCGNSKKIAIFQNS